MSALITCKSKMKNVKYLLEALSAMGIGAEHVSSSDDGKTIKLDGYGSQTAEVDVHIAKSFHKGYSDAGFKKTDDGTFEVFVDDLDDIGSLARSTGSTGKFSDAINQWYSAMVVKKTLKSKGMFPKIKRDGNKLRVVATAA